MTGTHDVRAEFQTPFHRASRGIEIQCHRPSHEPNLPIDHGKRIAGEERTIRPIEIGHVSCRVTGRLDDLERVKEDVTVPYEMLGGDRTRGGLADQSFYENEEAPFGNLIADPAPNTLRARDASKESFIGPVIVNSGPTERMHAVCTSRMIVVPVRQQDRSNVARVCIQRPESRLNIGSVGAHSRIEQHEAVSHANDVGTGLVRRASEADDGVRYLSDFGHWSGQGSRI